ncbi:DNA polymerase III subunit delta' [Candidatus Aerophobetes bacterium]|uniref:DNA polymerase III subunit delta n=1 Tax=Aerophobetes bacterium TaxID=2030807 RepID=A0A662D7F6_UNCAE|nr:MAG: DNA polymerase III subunit delta' [Candidatus Aerophobetes bacterium]
MNFKDIRGQKSALEKIRADIKRKKLSGAYLFTGPPGVGKQMTAISFAKALNCKMDSLNGCDRCSSCVKMEKMNHPNLRIINPEGESIKIEQIRNLKTESSFRVYEGRKKVWIINEAEKLTPQAANSLLKILEEPPGYLIIILITHIPGFLPPTILSRCRVVEFSSLSCQDISEILKNKVDMPAHLIPLISQLAQGSMSEALKLVRKEEIFQEREIIFKLIQKRKSLSGEVFRLSERWSTENSSDIETLLNIVLLFLRDLLMIKIAPDVPVFNHDKANELVNIKDTYSLSQLYKGIEAVKKSKFFIQANVSCQLALEVMWMKILYPEYT